MGDAVFERAVQKQGVDHVGAQPGEALLHAPQHTLAAQVVRAGPVALGQADAALGLQFDPLAQPGRASTSPKTASDFPDRWMSARSKCVIPASSVASTAASAWSMSWAV